MARRLLLEGSDIDELLDRVHAEHGADVEIVHAQERLVGGVGGFFARRRYEVAIQVPDDVVPDDVVPDDLVADDPVKDDVVTDDVVTDDETGAGAGRLGQEKNMSTHGFAAGSPIGATIYDALQDALGGVATPASSFEDLLSVADRQDGVGHGASVASAAPVASSAAAAAPVSSSTASPGAPHADAAHTDDTVFRPAPYVPAAALAAQPDVAKPDAAKPDDVKPDAAEPAPPHRPVSTETPGFEALLRDLMHQRDLALRGMHDAPATAAEPAPAAEPTPAQAPAPASGHAPAPAGERRPWSAPAPGPMVSDVPTPVGSHVPAADARPDVPAPEVTLPPAGAGDEPPTRRRATHRRSGPATTAPQALVELGLSPDSPVRAASPDPRTVLLDLLSDVAASAPTDLRGTAVLVGPLGPTRAVARRLLAETGLPRQCLLVVDLEDDELVVADVLMAAAERCGRHGAAVVVLAAGSARQDGRAAGRLAALLGSGPLTAVVDATRDAEATRSWLEALGEGGRRVDDLAAFDVTMTSQPLRLLELGHPVSWLDAVPATLGAWAAPCLERLRA